MVPNFAKDFDSVPHRKRIQKLGKYGVSAILLNWIKNFLSSQRQRVRIDSELSSWESVISGVPQGSVFDPILFIIFINDLPRDILAKLLLSVDDRKLLQHYCLLSLIRNFRMTLIN